jgi:hypothetical protein
MITLLGSDISINLIHSHNIPSVYPTLMTINVAFTANRSTAACPIMFRVTFSRAEFDDPFWLPDRDGQKPHRFKCTRHALFCC